MLGVLKIYIRVSAKKICYPSYNIYHIIITINNNNKAPNKKFSAVFLKYFYFQNNLVFQL